MSCYLHYREVPGADIPIVYDWAKGFIRETEHRRANNQHLLLTLDGYSAHVQFCTLNLLRENRIIVIALTSHTSHALQPLDVTVFGAYKSFLQAELHRAARTKSTLNAFDFGICIHNACARAFIAPTIREGFCLSGIWNHNIGRTDVSMLNYCFKGSSQQDAVSLESLVQRFNRQNVVSQPGFSYFVQYPTPRVPYRRMDYTCDLQAHALHVYLTGEWTTRVPYRRANYTWALQAGDVLYTLQSRGYMTRYSSRGTVQCIT